MDRHAAKEQIVEELEDDEPRADDDIVALVDRGASRARLDIALHDWSTLLAHVNESASKSTWALPPDDLFRRILAQLNPSKRGVLQEKYTACLSPDCSAQTRSVLILVLRRIAETFMNALLQMQSGRDGLASSSTVPAAVR